MAETLNTLLNRYVRNKDNQYHFDQNWQWEQEYTIPEGSLAKIEAIMKILYAEEHLSGDTQRDMAQVLQLALEEVIKIDCC